MGVVLDTSVFIHAERKGIPVQTVVAALGGLGALSVCAVTLMELAHGVARASSRVRRLERQAFLEAVQSSVTVVPLDTRVAIRAGLLNGELNALGFTVGLADAMIAATALLRGDSVATLNGKHFKVVPGLDVVEL